MQCVSDELVIMVTCVQDAPSGGDETDMTPEDTAVTTTDLTANNNDPDGDPLSIQNLMSDIGGTVTLNGDGTITFDPPTNFTGDATITYQVCDNASPQNCVEDEIVITVTPVNDGPSQGNELVNSTPANPATDVNIIANNVDPEGDALNVNFPNGFVGSAGGTFTNNGDGTVDYTPPSPTFSGMDELIYEVCDTGSPIICVTDTLIINVTPNETPLGGNENETAIEDTPEVWNTDDLLDNNSDPEGDSINPTLPNSSENGGTVNDNGDGTFTYNPPSDFCGEDRIIYDVCDAFSCVADTLIIDIACVQDAPLEGDEMDIIPEDTSVTTNVIANNIDPDGDNVTVNNASSDIGGTVTVNGNGTITFDPPADFNGTATITYEVCDMSGNCVTDEWIIEVTPVNDAPTSGNENISATLVSPAVDIDLLANNTDPEGDALSVDFVNGNTGNQGGTFTDNGDGTIDYIPVNPTWAGSDTLVYNVCDNGIPQACVTDTIVITITPNETPLGGNENETAIEDTPEVWNTDDLLDNNSDPEGDSISTTLPSSSENGGIVSDNGDGTFTYDPPSNFCGGDMILYDVCDDFSCVMDTLFIQITCVQDAPEEGDEMSSTPEDTQVTTDVVANNVDPDGDAVSVTNASSDVGGTVTVNGDGTITFDPPADFNGTATITYEVCDDAVPANCVEDVWIIDVIPVNDSPEAIDDEVVVNDMATTDPTVNDIDLEGDDLTVTIISDPNNGVAMVNSDGTITYDANPGFCGIDSLEYMICDNGIPVECATAFVIYTIIGLDTDNDGIPDAAESATADMDNDGLADFEDPDSDGDSIPDALESQVDLSDPCNAEVIDTDDDGQPDYLDEDADGDGIPDEIEAGADGNNPVDTDNDGAPDWLELDSDNDGIPDEVEAGTDPSNPSDTDNDGTPDFQEEDSDNDGIPDELEAGNDPNNPVDTDNDGRPDYQDEDSDNDTIPDEVEAGSDGNNPTDTDNDGTPDYQELDSDNDSIPDEIEAGDDPDNPVDTDNDGRPDYQDEDSDNDTIPDEVEAGSDGNNPVDTDNDGTPDYQELDSDNDSIPDELEAGDNPNNPVDTDNDGKPDYQDEDSDNDTIPDEVEAGEDGNNPVDTDNDGTPDFQEEDSDNDGIPDDVEAGDDGNNPVDTDNDGTPDYQDEDSDDDGIADEDESGDDPTNPVDTDNDGAPDYQDFDSDDDGISDEEETQDGINADCDGDDIPNWLDPDGCEITVIPGFSPNRDGFGDTWTVEGIEGFHTDVKVFNRWGQVVYQAIDYKNNWEGTFFKNGSLLPAGTYYYTIEFPNGDRNTMSGWLYLNQ